MKNTNRSRLLFFMPIIAALLITSPSSQALAQAYQGNLRFLESFAIRLYDQGDINQATKEFQRIQQIDPQNPVAADYLKKIVSGERPAAPAKTSAERMNAISREMDALKKTIAVYERDTQELETLIRDLITENDSLYAMLEKRTRELMELRSKLFGTSYADNYRELERTLPIARVPQRLHRASDYLPEPAARGPDMAINEPIFVERSRPGPEELLKGKRDLMLEKGSGVAQTTEKLTQVKNELSDMNARLKRANNESDALLGDIETYYLALKEDMAARNFDAQKAFSDLIIDYASKVRELESLKSSIKLRDNALTTVKDDITSHAEDVARLNKMIDEKDRQIGQLNKEVSKLNAENAAQKTTIDKQAADISAAAGQIEALALAVGKVETLLRANDQKIAALEARSSRTGMLIPSEKSASADVNDSLNLLKEETAKRTALTLELQEKNAELSRELAERAKELTEAQNTIRALKTEAASLKGESAGRVQELKDLRQRLDDLDSAAARKTSALSDQKEDLARFSEQLRAFESQVADLNRTIDEKEAGLRTAGRQIADQDARLEKQDSFILQLEEKAQALNEQKIALQDENDQLKAELRELQKSLAATPSSRNDITSLKEAIAERDMKIQDLSGENRRLMAMIEIYETQTRTGVRTPVRPVAHRVVDKAAQQAQLTRTLDQKENEALIQELQEELAARDKALAAAQALVAETELKSSAGEIKKDAMKNVIDKRDEEVSGLKAELDLARQDLASGEAQISELRKIHNQLFYTETELKDSQRAADDLKMEIDHVREELRAAHEASAKKDVALSKLESEAVKLQKGLARDPGKLATYQKKMQLYTWRTAQEIRDLKNRLADSKKRLNEKNSEISALQQKIKQLSRGRAADTNMPASPQGDQDLPPSESSGCLVNCEKGHSGPGCLLECAQQ